ncbi:MAG: hypothetical protein WB014_12970 [Methanosarcina sp.]
MEKAPIALMMVEGIHCRIPDQSCCFRLTKRPRGKTGPEDRKDLRLLI